MAKCGGSTVLHCGQLPADQLPAFRTQLAGVQNKIDQRKGDARSAAGGRKGHQKTPAMMRAVALQALATLEAKVAGDKRELPEELPKGGFTDVGLHTGGLPRDTAWYLVREAFGVSGCTELGAECG